MARGWKGSVEGIVTSSKELPCSFALGIMLTFLTELVLTVLVFPTELTFTVLI
jgi:hypothetical protein